jgi:hypothetical protein
MGKECHDRLQAVVSTGPCRITFLLDAAAGIGEGLSTDSGLIRTTD